MERPSDKQPAYLQRVHSLHTFSYDVALQQLCRPRDAIQARFLPYRNRLHLCGMQPSNNDSFLV